MIDLIHESLGSAFAASIVTLSLAEIPLPVSPPVRTTIIVRVIIIILVVERRVGRLRVRLDHDGDGLGVRRGEGRVANHPAEVLQFRVHDGVVGEVGGDLAGSRTGSTGQNPVAGWLRHRETFAQHCEHKWQF